ncbi:hypothetical protein EX30DRAFT_259041 [Ascodesmis nigricans]|uniref:Uncharacterized protein n=1 Tax=Ascodesmis nigricans TaxID=341454 RepID=A0A4S2MPI7_9PEZI|nr:hypothetical protein EX30DRAFT_259041 [Ascodesmis nigricans]
MYAEYSSTFAAPPPPFGLGLGQKYAWAPFESFSNNHNTLSGRTLPSTNPSPRRSSRRNSDPPHPPAVVVPPRRSSSHHQSQSKRVHFLDTPTAPATGKHHSRRHSTGRTFAEYFDIYKDREREQHHHGSHNPHQSGRRRKRSSTSTSTTPAAAPVTSILNSGPPTPTLKREHRLGYGYPLPPSPPAPPVLQTVNIERELNPKLERRGSKRSRSHSRSRSASRTRMGGGEIGIGEPFVTTTTRLPGDGVNVPRVVHAPEIPLRRSSRHSSRSAPPPPVLTVDPLDSKHRQSKHHHHHRERSSRKRSKHHRDSHSHLSIDAAGEQVPPAVESLYYLGSPKTVPLFVRREDTRFRKREEGRGRDGRGDRSRDGIARDEAEKRLPPGRGLRRVRNFLFGGW